MNTKAVFNLTLEKTVQVGEVSKKVKVETTNPEVTYEDMVIFANRALDENIITGCHGVNIEVNIMPNRTKLAEPIFTPAPDDDELYVSPSNRPRGVSYGGITPAAQVRKENEETRRRDVATDNFRRTLRERVKGYELNPAGFAAALDYVICSAAQTYNGMLVAADKDKAERDLMKDNLAKLNTENMELRQEVADAVRALQVKNKDLEKLARSYDVDVNQAKKAVSDYQERLRTINLHLEAIRMVS